MSAKKNPNDPKPIRQAGESLRKQMDEIWEANVNDQLFKGAFVFSALITGWVVVLSPGYTVNTMILSTVIGLGYLLYLFLKIKRKLPYYHSLKKGMLGERLVEEQLNEIRKAGFDVFHDFILKDEHGTENIDHIIIGPSGVFTLETKNWTRKNVPQDDRITYDGEVLKIGGYVQEERILKQPRRQAGKLQALLQPSIQEPLWVVPMMCFLDRYVQLTRFNPSGLQVVNQRGIGSFILSREKKLSPDTLRKLSAKLRELNRAD
ncbi:MAG: NERD domain-containing protein [Verrucomicrobia bacterium]|nr:NERD domain-containing protein [Verrucomicrobiota bacterium]MCH8511224.1 NERD domain-containing protein [Kiritimatiellia bacterium]